MMMVQRSSRVITIQGKSFRLSPTEYSLCIALGVLGKEKLIPRETLIAGVWPHPQPIPADVTNLQMVISGLRKKTGVDFIQVKRGFGYFLTEDIQFAD